MPKKNPSPYFDPMVDCSPRHKMVKTAKTKTAKTAVVPSNIVPMKPSDSLPPEPARVVPTNWPTDVVPRDVISDDSTTVVSAPVPDITPQIEEPAVTASDNTPVNSVPPVPPKVVQPLDPFDNLEAMRLSHDFAAAANAKPVFTSIAIKKPQRQEFIRTRSGEAWRFPTGTFTQKETRETYLVAPELHASLIGEIVPTLLVVAMTRLSAVPFIWPLTIPSVEGRPSRWHETALEAARMAESQWVKVEADMIAGCYVTTPSKAELPEPQWPDLSIQELLKLAFRQRYIGDLNHPVLRQLRGEI